MTQRDSVEVQYEAYPYPERKPGDEKKRLITGSPGHLDEVNHYLFAGRMDLHAPLKILFAGGGTGDGTIMMAQQLADRGSSATVTYLDLSVAARKIAEERAAVRGLAHIEFHTGSLLDLPSLGLGPFDYIDCCGVLHHLPDPDEGMKALAAVLKPDGGMGIMVYGRHGRAGVYETQETLNHLTDGLKPKDQVAFAKRYLAALPKSNRLLRNPFVRDHLDGGDAGLYDLLLHSRDRAYTVPEVAALVEGAGLAFTAFIEPAGYDPLAFTNDPVLGKRLLELSWIERCAVAESMAGSMKNHVFYAVPRDQTRNRVALPEGTDAVPIPRDLDMPSLAMSLKPGGVIEGAVNKVPMRFPLPPLGRSIIAKIDGEKSLGLLHEEIAADRPEVSWEMFMDSFAKVFAALNGLNKLVLRYPASRRK